jgi:tetratricopeptide (TPR) repeat protein
MTRWIGLLWMFAVLLARAENLADQLTAAGVKEFNAAYQAWDASRFAAATELLQRATTNVHASGTQFYWLGVSEFHRMLRLQTLTASRTNAEAAEGATDAAVAALNTAIKLDERHAESHALLGTLYGMKISGSLLRAAIFGPRVQKHRNAALRYGAGNPRVRYLLGTCQFHTSPKPAGLREALASFLEAETLFEAEAQRPAGWLEPRWGRSSCHTFIGRTYERLGQPAEAMVYFRRALAEHPADHLAREGLVRVEAKK